VNSFLKSARRARIRPRSLVIPLAAFIAFLAHSGLAAQQGRESATARLAALSGNMSAAAYPEISRLLRAGADTEAMNKYGATPLYMASQNGQSAIVKLLIDAKADVNAVNRNGTAPLSIASAKGRADIAAMLLAAKANVNTANKDGFTPLILASMGGHAKVVKLLLAAGANVNAARTLDGVTPLYIASEEGHADVVRLLLDAKADVNVKVNIHGSEFTPLSIARFHKRAEIAALLKKYGAKNAVENRTSTGTRRGAQK